MMFSGIMAKSPIRGRTFKLGSRRPHGMMNGVPYPHGGIWMLSIKAAKAPMSPIRKLALELA
jgi:hypothetical protein